MEIEKLQSLSDEILDELLIVWEKSVRSSHHFLKEPKFRSILVS